jgi:hypothetical protein
MRLRSARPTARYGLALTHEFTLRQAKKEYTVIIRLGDPSPVEPAKQYRRWLIDNKQFVPMTEKIKRVPRVERLLGAAHVYLWGDGIFSRYDARDWKSVLHEAPRAIQSGSR